MKKIKYIIISLTILLVILVGIVLIIKGKTENQYSDPDEGPQDTLIGLEGYTTREKNDNVFFSISDIVQEVIENSKENTAYYYGQEIYKIQTYDKANYYTYGLVQEEGKKQLEEYYLKVRVDMANNTYLTELLSVEEYSKAKNSQIKDVETDEIKANGNNQYEFKSFSSEEIARRYIKDYMLKVRYMPNKAFELLENEYKNEKFKNIENFTQYIQKNSSRFTNFTMQKYQCEVKENSLEYTVLDRYNNYYKIIAYSTLDYKIVLDNYTLEGEEYLDTYNNASEEEKVAICISKFIKLVNEKEYEKIYEKLDSTFKQNYFNTIEKFEDYVKKNLFNYNIATIESVEKIGDVYYNSVNIRSGVGVSAEEKNISVMIKLLEGTDFVMSFSVE